jgi:hypothetical protein
MVVTAVQNRTCCYLSTPEHIRSFTGRFIYLYVAKGEIEISPDALLFESRWTTVEIPLKAVVAIEVGQYSRWAKPFGLDYIAISYIEGPTRKTVLLTPTRAPGWSVACWETNRIVQKWIQMLKEATGKSTPTIV